MAMTYLSGESRVRGEDEVEVQGQEAVTGIRVWGGASPKDGRSEWLLSLTVLSLPLRPRLLSE